VHIHYFLPSCTVHSIHISFSLNYLNSANDHSPVYRICGFTAQLVEHYPGNTNFFPNFFLAQFFFPHLHTFSNGQPLTTKHRCLKVLFQVIYSMYADVIYLKSQPLILAYIKHFGLFRISKLIIITCITICMEKNLV